ncbi:7-cyano-7-deazaguanine synthase QueC [Anaeromyxobacter dehalogenans]|uniref:7-cyano-7-deazaguanine synthase n=1 Tax=Anaeromyxobacter dehalogenans (strain 2CP-C) TaxID=290397 RepID=QUEC_ANADE|nr:7-cyano-7-deazaguanine synthase QueC [Anaeromyxobacter dehalogenans]Q2IG55.1 RecName: Full=7-cyano-7-deazaguanine synthase; AltName: Full=7-cyano-7-carbaguanine synthase; AltName: Full=PreQ(0) synthase; AltName: Full=Queuosine biosynthesis protein QueC [Anaeromyxobacter dehalogenans 2CP-C]ABC83565.1 preQ(0) biosynthesis protein QueC [Anaeromyxobacter dehalogenans 2CP-C]
MAKATSEARRAVVLLSGGLDSSTCLAVARAEGLEAHCLSVDYGQRHKGELARARRIARALGAAGHRVVKVDLSAFGGSALTDAAIAVPKGRSEARMARDIPVTYVPARNTVMLSLALAHAEVIGAEQIFVGVNAIDYSGYPDCRPAFLHAFERLAKVATRAGVEGHPLRIRAPLLRLSKAGIVRLGTKLGVPYRMTLSCYDPIRGRACGRCDACSLRRKGFAEAGVQDPTQYAK